MRNRARPGGEGRLGSANEANGSSLVHLSSTHCHQIPGGFQAMVTTSSQLGGPAVGVRGTVSVGWEVGMGGRPCGPPLSGSKKSSSAVLHTHVPSKILFS